MVVAGVGSVVDYKKEKAFVDSRHKSDEKNVVSNSITKNTLSQRQKAKSLFFTE
jgi:hypothetical protein